MLVNKIDRSNEVIIHNYLFKLKGYTKIKVHVVFLFLRGGKK